MRILYITTVGSTMGFFRYFIRELLDKGHIVDIATNECSGEAPVTECYRNWGCRVYHISCSRNPFDKGNLKAIKEIEYLAGSNDYDIIHCHTPIAAACTRIACKKYRKNGRRVIYTAHGFHFFKGAPLKNWLIYYPIEWLCSFWTDVLVTINREDYYRAAKWFNAKRTVYVPGVGLDTVAFMPTVEGRKKIRKELGIESDRIMVLSVGELNDNKNHVSAIRALSGTDFSYVIVGPGYTMGKLQSVAEKCGVDLILTGERFDVKDYYSAADVYVLPSIREGLNVSLMEAMASGLPAACSRIRGNVDMITEDKVLFDPLNLEDIKQAVIEALKNQKELGMLNSKKAKMYDVKRINKKMLEVYELQKK